MRHLRDALERVLREDPVEYVHVRVVQGLLERRVAVHLIRVMGLG